MDEGIQRSTPQALLHEMGLNGGSIERRKRIVGIDSADLTRIAAIKGSR